MDPSTFVPGVASLCLRQRSTKVAVTRDTLPRCDRVVEESLWFGLVLSLQMFPKTARTRARTALRMHVQFVLHFEWNCFT
ncbi:hypothetical protein BHE74_00038437 [Ensete ventricosum]|nr:hypothetical protein BHE74_00038437 [Ensete ventricosum]RZR91466.1 hypothetical protein BHM03_00019584 [Ensete ventricosum]